MFEEEIEKHYDNLTTSAIQIIKLHKKAIKEKEELQDRINKLENWLKEQIERSWDFKAECYEFVLEQLQELKGVIND